MNSVLKLLFSLSLLSSVAFAYSDSDFDGVSDAKDQCPNSGIEDIVDSTGCSRKNELSISVGESLSNGSYGGTTDIATASTNMILGYKIKKWYLSSAFSYYSSGPSDPTVSAISGSSGVGDTYVTVGRTQSLGAKGEWSLGLLGSVKFATADTTIGTGANDYSIAIAGSYAKKRVSLLGSVGYTITGDTATSLYNDIRNVSAGIGYMVAQKLYLSTSFAYADPFVATSAATQSLSFFASYELAKSWNLSMTYSRGLSDATAANALSMMVTRKFK